MSWARLLAALLLLMSAGFSFAQEPTVPPETLFEQAQRDAADPLRLDLLMNLAQSQLRFRVESNFHGYEADEEFSKNSLTNFATAFANLSVLDRLQTVDFKDFVIAYEQERGKYGAFLQQYSEALGIEPNT